MREHRRTIDTPYGKATLLTIDPDNRRKDSITEFFVPGFTVTIEYLEHLARARAEMGYRALVYSQPREVIDSPEVLELLLQDPSDDNQRFNMFDRMADAGFYIFNEALDDEEKATLIGNSMGGPASTKLALRIPERVDQVDAITPALTLDKIGLSKLVIGGLLSAARDITASRTWSNKHGYTPPEPRRDSPEEIRERAKVHLGAPKFFLENFPLAFKEVLENRQSPKQQSDFAENIVELVETRGIPVNLIFAGSDEIFSSKPEKSESFHTTIGIRVPDLNVEMFRGNPKANKSILTNEYTCVRALSYADRSVGHNAPLIRANETAAILEAFRRRGFDLRALTEIRNHLLQQMQDEELFADIS